MSGDGPLKGSADSENPQLQITKTGEFIPWDSGDGDFRDLPKVPITRGACSTPFLWLNSKQQSKQSLRSLILFFSDQKFHQVLIRFTGRQSQGAPSRGNSVISPITH